MNGRFQGRVAVVTGASRGIGFAIARQLVNEGAKVCITARKVEALEEAAAALGSADVAFGIAGRADDVSHQAAVLDETISQYGRLDFLINNIGINPVFGSLMDLDLGAARKIVEVNCIAMLSWVQHAYKAWFRDHGGVVVNISSSGSLRPAPNVGIYGASKSMMNYLTAQLALELGPTVRVNGVAPAVVKTSFARPLFEGRESQVAAMYPLKRLGVPEDVAMAVAYLVSEESAWMTGQTIVLDGGMDLTSAK